MPIDINLLRAEKGGDPEKVRESVRRRYKDPAIVDEIIELDKKWRNSSFAKDQNRKAQNDASKEFGLRKKNNQDTADLTEKIRQLKADEEKLVAEEVRLKEDVDSKLNRIGNIVYHDVPTSNDEKDNRVVSTWGLENCRKPKDGETLYHHHQLLAMIDGYAPEPGTAIAGHRGYFLKGVGVLLNQALINFGLAYLMKHQYTPLQPPFFMRKSIMAETAQLEEFDEALYKVTGSADSEEMYLIATSEQPISAFHRGEWMDPKVLPLKYAGLSSCFRKEAGSGGRDVWGIFRIHQFEKVEQFVVCHPDNSWALHDEMLRVAEGFYQALGLPYHVINIVSGELNNAAARKYDLEAWFPTFGIFRELVSASNCTDYQARAMETRLANSADKKVDATKGNFVHMLNATLCATERTICCILENYQTAEGIVVPEALRPFMGGMDFIKFVLPCPENKGEIKVAKAAAKKEAAK